MTDVGAFQRAGHRRGDAGDVDDGHDQRRALGRLLAALEAHLLETALTTGSRCAACRKLARLQALTEARRALRVSTGAGSP